jgi:hypothetical protein
MTGRRTVLRAAVIVVGLAALLAFILTSCPSNRDGMPGRLAQARDEAESAARSAALALDLWADGHSTQELVCVQLADNRDEVVKAYKGIAELKAEDPVDVGRQKMLTDSMTSIVGQLNSANAAARGLLTSDPRALSRDLTAAADALADTYR